MTVNKNTYPPEYWDKFYKNRKLGWDIGYVSTPLKIYFDQLTNKKIKILVPGAGSSWEVEYLFKQGFNNTYLLDFSKEAVNLFLTRFPDFPQNRILIEDFFTHKGKYDLIVEQTFFSSIPRSRRKEYANKMYELLKPKGKLAGLIFNHEFDFSEPPFGGTPQEYKNIFSEKFNFKHFSTAYNSIKPRKGRELFFVFEKKD